ncbi:MAG: hypothetical protein ACK56I_22785, partial [bacterium]
AAVALGQHGAAVARAHQRPPVGLARGLDPFAQQQLGQRADATGAVEPAELGHRERRQLPPAGGREQAWGAQLGKWAQPHRPEAGGEQRRGGG